MKNLLHLDSQSNKEDTQNEYIDSSCSTPFVSAPSSPGRTTNPGIFYSAPASPMHFLLSSNVCTLTPPSYQAAAASEEFGFDANCYDPMSSADELFFNGEIRNHLHFHKQLEESKQEEASEDQRGRSQMKKLRNRSLRRIRSMSPIRDHEFIQDDDKLVSDGGGGEGGVEEKSDEVEAREDDPPSLRRNLKRWVSLKEFLYRSKSEGRNNGRHNNYFWSFSLVKDKKTPPPTFSGDNTSTNDKKQQQVKEKKKKKKKSDQESCGCVERDKGVVMTQDQARNPTRTGSSLQMRGKRLGLSAHYTTNRAHAEEMRKKTYLPYRPAIFGCLGGGDAAFNGFAARALNSVSSN